MVDLCVLRHAPTPWNEQGRIQGHTDVSLSEAGRATLVDKGLPAGLDGARWVTSPLKRCRETAQLLGAPDDLAIEPRLMEMNWGEWEGYTVKALRAEFGAQVSAAETYGLDMRPPGGESPREVQLRVHSWLREIAAALPRASPRGPVHWPATSDSRRVSSGAGPASRLLRWPHWHWRSE